MFIINSTPLLNYFEAIWSNKWYQSRFLEKSFTTSRFMASSNSLFAEGNSIHRPPIFNGEGYHFWKTRMQIIIEAIDLNIWEAIEIGSYVPTIVDASTSTTTGKPRDKWTEVDWRRIQYNLKEKNIITFALGIDEYFRVSNCSNAKEMWDTLQLTHEGTTAS